MVTPERLAKMKRVLKTRQWDLRVFMDYVYSEHNLSAIVRSADAVNVGKVYYRHQKNIKINKHIAMKADQWMDLENVINIDEFYQNLKNDWYQIIVTVLDSDSVDFRQVDYTQPTLIVLGNEVDGVSQESLKYATQKVYIPMYGMSQSLNVSVANAVMLYEAQRQRQLAGMYDKMQIPSEVYEETLKKWLARHEKTKT